MIMGWKGYSTIPIDFETDLDTSSTTFYLPNKHSDQASDQAIDQAILEFCREAKSSSEIMQFIGMKHRTYFRNNILKPLIEKNLLVLTIPDKPKSPNQKYKTKEQ